MIDQTTTSAKDPLSVDIPLIPARMVNEYVYCPRLGYLMWVQGEFAHNEFTVDGKLKHSRVDKEGGTLPKQPEEEAKIHARSVWLSSGDLGVTAKVDLVEGGGSAVTPVDYKRGKRPHIAAGAYEPERVQLCIQGLLLREHGFQCEHGVIYYVASKERVSVAFDEDLISQTRGAITTFRQAASSGAIPKPLADSPKCPRCSLVGICLPDEIRFLTETHVEPRPVFPSVESGLPLYVQAAQAYVCKDGECLVIEEKREKVAEARLVDTSQVVIYGNSGISTPALHECMRREIPVTFMSYGGWFIGHAVSTGHRNVEVRTSQYRASFDEKTCLGLARSWVAAKIANCRALLRRNWRGSDGEEKAPANLMLGLEEDAKNAMKAESLEVLLGTEGAAASRYFQNLSGIFKQGSEADFRFDFSGRNRRPPKDPVNAMLSFAYAMLVREWGTTLSAVGLDPYRGFYHQPRFGRMALALDMMEPFRPLIADSVVLMAINNGEIKPADFISTAAGCNLTPTGRKRFIAAYERRMAQEVTHPIFKYRISYRRVFEVQSRLLARFLTGEIPQYPNFLTR